MKNISDIFFVLYLNQPGEFPVHFFSQKYIAKMQNQIDKEWIPAEIRFYH